MLAGHYCRIKRIQLCDDLPQSAHPSGGIPTEAVQQQQCHHALDACADADSGLLYGYGSFDSVINSDFIPHCGEFTWMESYQFGVILVFAFAIGLCTPPVGTSLFIGCKIANIPVESSIKAFLPFYIIMMILLILFTYIPALSLGLPMALGLL